MGVRQLGQNALDFFKDKTEDSVKFLGGKKDQLFDIVDGSKKAITNTIKSAPRQGIKYLGGVKNVVDKIDEFMTGASSGFEEGTIKPITELFSGQELQYKPSFVPKTKTEMFGQALTYPGKFISPGLKGMGVNPNIAAVAGFAADVTNPFGGGEEDIAKLAGKARKLNPKIFKGFSDLTTRVLERLKGKSITSKQEILDFTNMPELKQAERDLIRNVVNDFGRDVPVEEFANKVKTELLPLKSVDNPTPRWEGVTLKENRGPIASYKEHIYESPIKTSAGEAHFGDYQNQAGQRVFGNKPPGNYFAHTRIEDLPATRTGIKDEALNEAVKVTTGKYPGKIGDTRRVIELQSDLFQKGGLESEKASKYMSGVHSADEFIQNALTDSQYREFGNKLRAADKNAYLESVRPGLSKEIDAQVKNAEQANINRLQPLEPYRNTWHERVIREEVKQAAKDGKTKLQFPTGETVMKIEGLGEITSFTVPMRGTQLEGAMRTADVRDLVVGNPIRGQNQDWIITDVLGDGKFKAVEKNGTWKQRGYSLKNLPNEYKETFDISGKVDTNNPIYKFYEKEVGRYLKNKYGAELITDPQGVKWWQVDVKSEMASEPVLAYGKATVGALGGLAAGSALSFLGGDDSLVNKIKRRIETIPDYLEKFAGKREIVINNEPEQEEKLLTTSRPNTNYDPLSESQTREGTTGEGAVSGIKLKEGMIAVPRKRGTQEPIVPYGTVIYIPEFDRNFLVVDLKKESVDSIDDIRFDFAVPASGSRSIPKYNKPYTFRIVEKGIKNNDFGHADARRKIKNGIWETIGQ